MRNWAVFAQLESVMFNLLIFFTMVLFLFLNLELKYEELYSHLIWRLFVGTVLSM